MAQAMMTTIVPWITWARFGHSTFLSSPTDSRMNPAAAPVVDGRLRVVPCGPTGTGRAVAPRPVSSLPRGARRVAVVLSRPPRPGASQRVSR